MLQWGHDFSAVEIALLAAYVAAIKEELQWGHDFSAVEIFAKNTSPFLYTMLQWGHDFSAVEILERHS